MRLTNYPNGITSFGIPLPSGGGDEAPLTGNRYYVDSGAANANDKHKGTDKENPLATWDGANNKCTANNGDIIVLMPGHTETVNTSTVINPDVAGVTVKGLGNGSSRPTITFTTSTGAKVNITGANTKVENILFVAGVDGLTAPITAGAADVEIKNCEYRDSSSYQSVTVVRATSVSGRLKVTGCKIRGTTAAGSTSAIHITGGAEQVEIVGNDIRGRYAYNISNTSTAAEEIRIENNTLINRSSTATVLIDLVATATGVISYNKLRNTSGATGKLTNMIDASDCELYENYGVTADNETGGLVGTVST